MKGSRRVCGTESKSGQRKYPFMRLFDAPRALTEDSVADYF